MADEKMSLSELDETLAELIELGLIQRWPTRVTAYRAMPQEETEGGAQAAPAAD